MKCVIDTQTSVALSLFGTMVGSLFTLYKICPSVQSDCSHSVIGILSRFSEKLNLTLTLVVIF